jgi:hypothetical protein
MKTKMIRAWGNAGRMQAFKWLKERDVSKMDSAPEAIWRQEKYSDGTIHFCRAYKPNQSEESIVWSDVPGDFWATATLTIREWFVRYGK